MRLNQVKHHFSPAPMPNHNLVDVGQGKRADGSLDIDILLTLIRQNHILLLIEKAYVLLNK